LAKTKKAAKKFRGEIWYIGFRPLAKPKLLPKPWRWFIDNQFAHCMAFRYDPVVDGWIFAEWAGTCLHIEVWRGEKMDNLFAWLKQDGALISFEVSVDPDNIVKFRMPFYCVTWVKHLLGIRKCAAVTPKQLFSALKKRGGSVIFEP
jgi:hypothetical protein